MVQVLVIRMTIAGGDCFVAVASNMTITHLKKFGCRCAVGHFDVNMKL